MNRVSTSTPSVSDVFPHINANLKNLPQDPISSFCKPSSLDTTILRQMIAEKAYYRAEARGFVPGQEIDDWLSAQAEVNQLIFSSYL
jgi:hypothetical protein